MFHITPSIYLAFVYKIDYFIITFFYNSSKCTLVEWNMFFEMFLRISFRICLVKTFRAPSHVLNCTLPPTPLEILVLL